MHPNIHSSTIYNIQDMEKTPVPTNKGMDKEDVIHTHVYTMEYYLAIKKNEIMLFAATWMDLQIIIPS